MNVNKNIVALKITVELTSAAELLREPPAFYANPHASRRLVKRLVR